MTRRKDGLWQEVLTIKGKRKYFYGKTKAEVLRKLRDYKEDQEHGVSFKSVAEKWWKNHEKTLAYNTAKSYKPAKERAIDAFGDRSAKDITPQEISVFIKAFSRDRADKTAKTQLLVLRLIFNYGVEIGALPFNPARELSVPGNLPKRKVTSPSSADIKRVKESTDCTFGMFAYWALYTGMRRGELLALEWSDVDIEARRIKITKSLYHVSNKPHIKEPKTKTSVGEVPILDALLSKITPSKGLVFPNEKGEYITETQFQRLWELYQKESGVEATPHQFRHAYATMLFEAGIPPEEAQALLRHAQLSTTMDIYTDLRDAQLKKIQEKVYGIDIV